MRQRAAAAVTEGGAGTRKVPPAVQSQYSFFSRMPFSFPLVLRVAQWKQLFRLHTAWNAGRQCKHTYKIARNAAV
jgi:hypothetical protein